MITNRADGGSLHVLAAGTGDALLFIHGAGGNAASWSRQFAAFAPSHKVVAFDLPGFGRSGPVNARDLSGLFATAPAAALDAAGVARASVICQSLGGWSGLRFALAFPERVQRLVLVCTMAGVAHPPALAAFAAARDKMDARGPASLALHPGFRAAEPAAAYLYDQIAAFNPPLDPALGATAFAPEGLVQLATLARLACPVLVIAGEHDPIWPPEALTGIASAIPGARFEIMPGVGHSPYFEQSDAFNGLLRSFIG